MNCNQAREQFFDAIEPGSALASHVASCAACAAELKSLQETMALMDEWKTPEPSAYFDTRLRARLAEVRREEAASAGFWSWLRKPVLLRPALVVAMGLAFVIGVNFYHQAAQPKSAAEVVAKGTAVSDLQALDKNEDLYAEYDLLDDIGSNHTSQHTQRQGSQSEL